jgi:hypothetical protein
VHHSKSQETFFDKETLEAKSLEAVLEGQPLGQLGWERLLKHHTPEA